MRLVIVHEIAHSNFQIVLTVLVTMSQNQARQTLDRYCGFTPAASSVAYFIKLF
ncbi:hypothetical protein EPYR_01989 [Erwinia pyrifoliae DSM 12163]|nr:hypothetical protein EPYR_01989 [Erwinia pyrifoliae DSM 12163]